MTVGTVASVDAVPMLSVLSTIIKIYKYNDYVFSNNTISDTESDTTKAGYKCESLIPDFFRI